MFFRICSIDFETLQTSLFGRPAKRLFDQLASNSSRQELSMANVKVFA